MYATIYFAHNGSTFSVGPTAAAARKAWREANGRRRCVIVEREIDLSPAPVDGGKLRVLAP